jgi:hypothetical protein
MMLFEFSFERTYFSDDGYSIVGRALAYAVKFEDHCRALNILMSAMKQRRLRTFSFDDNASFQLFLNGLEKLTLNEHISQILRSLEPVEGFPEDMVNQLHAGRTGRNQIVHEVCLGIEQDIETDGARERLIKHVSDAVRNVAEANSLVLLFTCGLTGEPVPTSQYLKAYPDRVVRWVCETEEG